MKKVQLTVGAAILVSASVAMPMSALAKSLKVGPDQDYTTIQSAVDAASDGDTVMVYPGTYHEAAVSGPAVRVTKALRMKAKVKKGGPEVILEGQPGQTDGILVAPVNDTDPHIEEFRIKGFTIQNFANNGIRLRYVDSFRIESNKVINNAENGIFPTLSANGLVKKNLAYGSDDAALWVEASTNVRVTQNELHSSPTGLEVTVSKDIFMDKNDIHDNTTGVGLYHPNAAGLGLPPDMVPGNWILEKNHIYNNNTVNSAPGGMAAALPAGGGVLVLGVQTVQVLDNLIENNDFYGVSVVDWCIANDGSSYNCDDNPPLTDPRPYQNIIGQNTLVNNGTNPDPDHPLADYAANLTYVAGEAGLTNRYCENDPNVVVSAIFGPGTVGGKCP